MNISANQNASQKSTPSLMYEEASTTIAKPFIYRGLAIFLFLICSIFAPFQADKSGFVAVQTTLFLFIFICYLRFFCNMSHFYRIYTYSYNSALPILIPLESYTLLVVSSIVMSP